MASGRASISTWIWALIFDLGDLGSLEDLLDADFEREFEDFKRDAGSGAWNPWGGGLSGF